MSKPWLGYLSAVFLLLAGVFQILGGNPKIGIFFTFLSIVSVVVKLYINKRQRKDDQRS